MDFGMRDTYAPSRSLPSSSSVTRLGAVNSELFSFRSRLTGLQPEADTDNDEILNMFDDASCILVETRQTPVRPSTLSTPLSPMERCVIYRFPSFPIVNLNPDPQPNYFTNDADRTAMIRAPATTRPALPKRSSSSITSPYHRKRARTITDDNDPDDSDWVFPEIPTVAAAPFKEPKNPTFVLVLRRARTAAAGLRKKCRAVVHNEYQYLSMAVLCAAGGGHYQARQPGPTTKCCVVG